MRAKKRVDEAELREAVSAVPPRQQQGSRRHASTLFAGHSAPGRMPGPGWAASTSGQSPTGKRSELNDGWATTACSGSFGLARTVGWSSTAYLHRFSRVV